jgi:hypothetical protein
MRKIRKHSKKISSLFIINFLVQIINPVELYALTSGPSQPEVESFQPISVSDMVDPLTGDFSYNIPLIDVEGYPINLSYSSGIGSDQEASWVGLGWNINPGAITRNMRGIPDEFNGDIIETEYNLKPNRTVGGSVGGTIDELFGAKLGGLVSLNYSVGINYNNYNGYGIENTINASFNSGDNSKGPLNGSLGITAGQNGLTISPKIGFAAKVADNNQIDKMNYSIGSSFNSRSGLGALTLSSTNKKTKKEGIGGSHSFGMHTYTPSINMPMRNYNISFSFKTGLDIFGTFTDLIFTGYYSEQAMNIPDGVQKTPAYGYNNSQNMIKDNDGRHLGVMDINRSWDVSFNKNTPRLPVTSKTFDLLSVSGQGISGTFRPFRNDIGSVSDNLARNTSAGGSAGGEAGGGNLLKVGLDVSANSTNTIVSGWSPSSFDFYDNVLNYSNPAADRLQWKKENSGNLFEPYTYKQIGELSVDDEPHLYENIGKEKAVRIVLKSNGNKDYNVKTSTTFETAGGTSINMLDNMSRQKRLKRNQTLSILTFAEIAYNGHKINDVPIYNGPLHHPAELTVIRNDGVRYIYGVPAYNTYQEETTFSMGMARGDGTNTSGHQSKMNKAKGTIDYNYNNSDKTKGDNSINNKRGNDDYYQSVKMPPYAHSYLLSAVLSTDYVDADKIPGPSEGDLGNYTVFKYIKSGSPYKWRTPFNDGEANYNEGVRCTFKDDKANYIYGEKELWYLEKIETKNSIAIFTVENRKDGYESNGRNGGIGSQTMKCLKKISLYSKPDYAQYGANAIPIKEVHFEYDYSLCPGTENNINYVNGETLNTGKLTLKKVYFTYGSSNRSAFSPYTFNYTNIYNAGFNPAYGVKNHDRWGNYKENKGDVFNNLGAEMPNSDFPYVEQNKEQADKNATAWTLSKINLPSGGVISIYAESDDYAFVQNKRAMQMFKIVSVTGEENPTPAEDFFSGDMLMEPHTLLNPNSSNQFVCFKLQEPIPINSNSLDIFRKNYLEGIKELYFKVFVKIDGKFDGNNYDKNYEYITGYAEIETSGLKADQNAPSGYYSHGYVKLKKVLQGDNSLSDEVNPISKAGWHFARTYLPRLAFNDVDDETPGIVKFVETLGDLNFVSQLIQTIKGANGLLKEKDFCKKINPDKSFIRLVNPNKKKLGGGLRVKKVELSDEWDKMVSNNSSQIYGQEYDYTTIDEMTGEVISSGVACWEPQLGGDENPFFLPIWNGNKQEKLLIPDDRSFLNGPLGQEFYPSPSVGYSKVTVKNLSHNEITRHATGKIVNEFYTAKDFPTISSSTGIDPKERSSNPIFKMFKIECREYVTVSQGHVIELNDMHGKQKAMWVYQEGNPNPISGVEYKYQSEKYDGNSFRLTNDATIVRPDGTTDIRPIGVEYDIVPDFRQEETSTISGGLNSNLSNFLAGFIPGIVPMALPSGYKEYTRFRSAVVTKVINKYGILSETIAHDLGSSVSTANLAYDSESGLVLLTKTKNNFEDEIYNFNYPAHWYYDAMGQAYKNLGLKFYDLTVNSSGEITISNASKYFIVGDEIVANNDKLAWVKSVSGNTVTLMNEMGNAFKPNLSGLINKMIITRSGRRNLIGVSMGSITSLSNPLDALRTGNFENVLNTSSQLFKDEWGTFCECFVNNNRLKNTNNPYVIGTRGVWRAFKSYVFLVNRKHSWKNNNTSIREDGVYNAFNPYWKWNGSKWVEDQTNWTWVTEITKMNPYGAELENVDALNRYSAAVYGYNNTIPTGVGANTQYYEIAYDGFEDYDFNTCSDDHFSYRPFKSLISNEAHTGKKSLSVSSGGNPVEISRVLIECNTLIE